MVGCAAITIYGCDQYHFFNGNTYARIDWAPGQSDVLIHGPSLIINDWKSLRDAGFSQIDAILPLDQVYKAFVFSGPRFCRIRYLVGQGDDALLTGVSSITEHWRSLAKAGFDHVDGAMVVPGATNQAYFFSGSKVCRVAFNTTDELLEGPYEINKRCFKTLTHAYMFSGAQAAHVNLVPGGDVDVIAGPNGITEDWQSLHQAGFY